MQEQTNLLNPSAEQELKSPTATSAGPDSAQTGQNPLYIRLPQKPESLPDKFWDPEGNAIRLDALITSYTELERKLSAPRKTPESEDEKRDLLRLVGLPDTADQYEVDVSHGLFDPDPELNNRLHEMGFTPEQVQAVYDLAAEKMVPMILDVAGEFQAERELERLEQEFGGRQRWQEISRQLLQFGRKNLPAEVLDALSSSYEGVMTLYRMMQAGEPDLHIREGEAQENLTREDLRAMMRDPKYWREKDPAFIARVSKGFEKLFAQS